ncbi:MAG: Uma2 family endonuclease [Candidatus Bipolaricaulis sp.]|nr:Uma2 family endonuclease [Candidatus Bipolaricaulis sp.]
MLPEEVSKAKGVPLQVCPALVVEIMSPTTRTIDLREKVKLEDYALARIPAIGRWTRKTKEDVVHRLQGGDHAVNRIAFGKVESQTIPGFWLEAGWLFQEPLPPIAECLGFA